MTSVIISIIGLYGKLVMYNIKILKIPKLIKETNNLYKLKGSLKVIIKLNNFINIITVPDGFVTDLASIPKVFQWVYSPSNEKSKYPSILHDYMYHNGCDYTRKEADLVFYYFLRKQGFNIFRANLYYMAVRLFGYRFYKQVRCH